MGDRMTLQEALAVIRGAALSFYVYVLRRPSGEPFYVGKGSGDRIAMHSRNAARANLDQHLLRVIRAVERDGGAVSYEIAGWFSDEADAFAEERRLIALYGRLDKGFGPLVNHTDGGEGASNPSDATLRKRAKKLRAVMQDREYKAAAIKALRSVEHIRRQRAVDAMRTPEFKAFKAKQMREKWADPAFRESTMRASKQAQDLIWKAKHSEGIARVQADPEFHARRNAGIRNPEVQARIKAALSTPESIAHKREKAIAQRKRQEEARQRCIALAGRIAEPGTLPNHRAGIAEWLECERRLLEKEVA